MTRPITPEFQLHLQQETTTLCTCWRLTRRDNVTLGFTDFSESITFDSVTYTPVSGFSPTAIDIKTDFSVDNLDVEGVLNSSLITEADLYAGLYDYAEIKIFVINHQDTTQGEVLYKRGWLGEVSINKSMFRAELRSLSQKLSQTIGDVYSPVCRAQLGDSKCGIDASVSPYTEITTIASVASNQTFTISNDSQDVGYYTGGLVEWVSGSNQGLRREIKENIRSVVLTTPMPYSIEVGDSIKITVGCDKTFDTCIAKFNNAINFRGEPGIPGNDKMLQTSSTRDSSH